MVGENGGPIGVDGIEGMPGRDRRPGGEGEAPLGGESRRDANGKEKEQGRTHRDLGEEESRHDHWAGSTHAQITALVTFSPMRIVLQRVSEASVRIGGDVAGAIDRGFLVLVGFSPSDSAVEVAWMAEKVIGLRLFADAEGKMNLDLAAVGGALLVVSQFTLYGDAAKGRRPSFIDAARPEIAIPLYEAFVAALRASGVTVATGEFGADMQVALTNDGPVTLLLERNAS